MKQLTIAFIKQMHIIEAPMVSLEFFMKNYCDNLKYEKNITRIEVKVSETFSFYF